MTASKKLAMKETKDELDTCNGYFGELPVRVATLCVSMTVSKKLAMNEFKYERGHM